MSSQLPQPREIAAKPKAYAFERSLGIPPAEACRRAGGKVENGQATKWEKNRRVQAWISYYRASGQDEEIVAAKRARVEDELNLVAFSSMDDFVTIKSAGQSMLPVLDLSRINGLPDHERRAAMAAVKSIRYTDNGPAFELHGKLDALAQLRDMHGFKAPAKVEATGKNGAPLFYDLSKLTNEQLAALEGIAAAAAASA